MKKTIILTILFGIIILGTTIGIYSYISKSENKISSKYNIQNEIDLVSEKVEDECVYEMQAMENEVLITSSKEEKISPNCKLTLRKAYKKCGHIVNEYLDIPLNLVNKTRRDIENEYKDWKIEKFSETEIVLYKEFDGECNEHFLVKDEDNKIVIYKINDENKEEEYKKTDISTEYLTETDKIELKNGIRIIGSEKLNEFIEDFE